MDADLCPKGTPLIHKEDVVEVPVRQKHIFQFPPVAQIGLCRARVDAGVNNGKFLCRILQNQIGIGSVSGAFQADNAHKTPHTVWIHLIIHQRFCFFKILANFLQKVHNFLEWM